MTGYLFPFLFLSSTSLSPVIHHSCAITLLKGRHKRIYCDNKMSFSLWVVVLFHFYYQNLSKFAMCFRKKDDCNIFQVKVVKLCYKQKKKHL